VTGLELKNHFSLTSSFEVDALCKPALSSIGVSYFNYIKIYNDDGSRELLTNNNAWIDHFYKNSLFVSAGAIDVEHLLPKGFFLWSELDGDDPIYSQGRESFNIDNGISFVIKREDVTYLYIFASTRDNYRINNFYLRNIDLFKRFIMYFNDKASDLIKDASENRIYLPDKQIIQEDRLNRISISKEVRESFFRHTEIEKFYLKTESDSLYLTKKQAECAFYLIAGATAKQCAQEMNISFRTVESYLSAIKEKVFEATGRRQNKEELIKCLKSSGVASAVF
jgi:predicted DNA binding protein